MTPDQTFFEPHDWQVTARSVPLNLSAPMKRALRALAVGESIANAGRATRAALVSRGLCDELQRLTGLGRVTAIGLMPLATQCRILGLPLCEMQHQWEGVPEAAAARMLADEPARVFADEGRIVHALIHALVLPRLFELASNAWKDTGGAERARSYLYLYYTAYLHLLRFEPRLTELMLEDIQNQTVSQFQRSWATLADWNRTLCSHPAARTSIDLATDMLAAVGRPTLYEIATRAFETRFLFGCGWPDLTLLTDTRRVRLVEVKVTDRLHASQIVLFPILRDSIGLDVSVLKLVRPRSAQRCASE